MKMGLKIVGVLVGVFLLLIVGYVGYAVATAAKRVSFPAAPYPKVAVPSDAAAIERGRYLVYGPAHCAQCHSIDKREQPELLVPGIPLQGGLEFAMGPIGTTYAANLTPDPETGIGKRTPEELARTIRTGILHDGTFSMFMRFSTSNLSDEDLGDVIAYLRSAPPVKNAVKKGEWGILGKALLPIFPIGPRPDPAPKHVPAGADPTVERGEYLANHVALCVGCHSTIDMKTFQPYGPKAGGGNPEPSHGSDSDMEFATPNLTSDPTGYLGQAPEDAFITRMRNGRAIPSSIMPWESIKVMTDVDLKSVYQYLKSLPPVKNDNGPSYRKKGWKRPSS